MRLFKGPSVKINIEVRDAQPSMVESALDIARSLFGGTDDDQGNQPAAEIYEGAPRSRPPPSGRRQGAECHCTGKRK